MDGERDLENFLAGPRWRTNYQHSMVHRLTNQCQPLPHGKIQDIVFENEIFGSDTLSAMDIYFLFMTLQVCVG